MINVFFWRDVHCGDQELFEPYKAEIQQLQAGELHGLNFEKLHVSGPFPVYSIRTNRKTRLLLTIHHGNLCLLDVVENHDYHKSRFLRSQESIRKYLETQAREESAAAAESYFPNEADEKEFKKSLTTGQKEEIQFSPLEWHKKEQVLIQLSEDQESALKAPLPAIVYGPAGCGKTTLAMSMLMDYVRRHMGDAEALPVLYVSQSATLVRAMREQWRAMVSDDELFEAVCFKTYDELVDEQQSKPGFKRIEDEVEHFSEWYAHLPKQTRRKAAVELNAQDLWREFRIRSGFSEQEYIDDLGRRESALSEKNLREQVCQLYQSYKRHLEEKKLISPQLDVIEARHRYPFIMADEAQDLSYAQLVCLSKMSHDGRNVYLSGEHQVLYDGIPRVPFLKRMLSKTHQPSFVKLGGTYRCSKQVTLAVNELIKMKLEVTGGLADKDESPVLEIRSNEQSGGEFLLLHPKSPEIEALKHEAQSVRLAVVTSEALLDEARREFGTELVFTAKGIKGLEFPTIVYWCPFEERDKKAWSKVSAETDEQEMRLHRAKPGMGDNTYCPYWNEVITAATRAQNKLVMVQENTHHTERMRKRLQKIAELSTSEPKSHQVYEPSTDAEWEALAVTLLKDEKEKQAEAIYVNRLHHTKEEFQVFKALHVKISAVPMTTHVAASGIAKTTPMPAASSKPSPIAAEPASTPPVPVKDTETTSRRRKKTPAQPASIAKATPIAAAAAATPSKPPHIELRERVAKELLLHCTAGWTDRAVGRLDKMVKLLKLISQQDVFDFLTIPIEEGEVSTLFMDVILANERIAENFIRHVVNSVELINKWPQQLEKYLKASSQHPSKKLLSMCSVIERLSTKRLKGDEALAHIATRVGDLGALVKLYNWGVDVHKAESDGTTLVHVAAHHGQVDVIAQLHKWKVDLNQVMLDRATPAYLAAQFGHVKVLAQLRDYNVNLDEAMDDGSTLAHVASQFGHIDVLVQLHEWKVDLNKTRGEGVTIVHVAALNGHTKIIAKFYEWGIDLNPANSVGIRPAHLVALKGRVAVLVQLHDLVGNDINKTTNDGQTLAHFAAQNGHVDILIKLHEWGFDLTQPTPGGVTPVHLADKGGHAAVIAQFQAWGIGLNKGDRARLGFFADATQEQPASTPPVAPDDNEARCSCG